MCMIFLTLFANNPPEGSKPPEGFINFKRNISDSAYCGCEISH